MSGPYQIEPEFVWRPWGSEDLSPLFPKPEKKVGEVWFKADFPLLVKFIFTEANLSLQVHPDDCPTYTGKTEMWHILDAKPDSRIYIGFRRELTKEQVLEAIAASTLDEEVAWVPARKGDTFFTPAGVVHAIGAGIKLCEIQQNSDITYRLYDWGSDRELHVEKGMAVAETTPYRGERQFPVQCKKFEVDQLELDGQCTSDPGCRHLLIALEGEGKISGQAFRPGQVWMIPSAAEVTPQPSARLLRARCPSAQ